MSDDLSSSAAFPADEAPTAKVSSAEDDSPITPARALTPVRSRELFAVIAWTALADVLIFRSDGFTGPALFFALVPILFWIGCYKFLMPRHGLTISFLLLLVALRLLWMGSQLTLFAGVVLTIALSMVAAGAMPYVLEGIAFASRVLFEGAARIAQYRFRAATENQASRKRSTATWLLPVVSVMVFGTLFILANPDLVNRTTSYLADLADYVWRWFSVESAWEIPFCIFALLIGAGFLCPRLPMFRFGPQTEFIEIPDERQTSDWLPAFRNSLVTLIALFALYLCFEFVTLWKREFPEGFYYAGYAHQGAAWLTVALALATLLLSAIFNGKVLQDPRVTHLRWLAWFWSALNLLLALAVYNRLTIYVGYNGMTRMRTVGFFGITVVVIGFLLVLYKIANHRSFWWLVRYQLMAVMVTIIAFSLFPVDYVAHRYNANRVNDGYLPPSVMVAVKQINDEGMLTLLSLTDHPDQTIREGVQALLANRQSEIETNLRESTSDWKEYQASDAMLLQQLRQNQATWAPYLDSPGLRTTVINRFKNYAMKWY
ncbi:hypothetical protein CA13_12910 [Planctomycetes bacterium CA13]|uniref:Uncharacterized protein n=1 Tax=Novipirellula herctigrandis TaxID=2527986 RepID=A0A5C5YXX9_9BACT|nr:hypothetical protein CA13_12910 [Planctomycetes bacterium CA13]